MAKKNLTKKKTAQAEPVLRAWQVQRPNGTTETILAHGVDTWDGTLTLVIRQRVADQEMESVSVRAFAPGQWTEYTLEHEPTAAPVTAQDQSAA